MNKTITRADLETLFWTDEEVAGWKRSGGNECDSSCYVRTSRWHDIYWLVLEDASGDLWGVTWESGLTEYQDDIYPWDMLLPDAELKLTPLEQCEVTKIVYRRKEDH